LVTLSVYYSEITPDNPLLVNNEGEVIEGVNIPLMQ
jgi:hypothetical protein